MDKKKKTKKKTRPVRKKKKKKKSWQKNNAKVREALQVHDAPHHVIEWTTTTFTSELVQYEITTG